jgi:RND superfamily putative drug exporter
MFKRFAAFCYDKRKLVLALWVVGIAAVMVLSSVWPPDYKNQLEVPDSESGRGIELLEDHFSDRPTGTGGRIVFSAEQGVDDPEVKAAMEELFAEAARPSWSSVISPYSPEGFIQIAPGGKVAYAEVNVDFAADAAAVGELGAKLYEDRPRIEGLDVEIGGEGFAKFEPPESEMIGLAFAIIILIISFGSVLAMGLPIGVAVSGVAVGLTLGGILSNLLTVPDFATTIGAMIGLGVGIDYALFIVTRHREGLHADLGPRTSAIMAIDTAGRAVLFAGSTVVVSLMGMLLIGLSFVSGLGISAALTVSVTMLASVTLLPALLGFAGERLEVTKWRGLLMAGSAAIGLLGVGIKVVPLALMGAVGFVGVFLASFAVPKLREAVPRKTPKPLRETVWYKWSRIVQHRPWRAAIGGILILLVLSAPVLSLRLAFPDEGNYSTETTTRRAYDMIADAFGDGFNGPILIVLQGSSAEDIAAGSQPLYDALLPVEGIATVTPAIPSTDDPEVALMAIVPETSPQDVKTEKLVDKIRDDIVPQALEGTDLTSSVSGRVALQNDFSDYMAERMILFFAVVLGLSFLLLMMVFRSLLVPVKAVIMNMLSIAAAYGIVVAVFQWGWGKSLLNLSQSGPIEPFIPMMLFAILFGLSMDYEVFLLSRMKEEYDRTGDSTNSVADGLAATARVITAAALIMVVVFGSFMLEDLRTVKLFGLGLASAILIDATLVRMLLVPATMQLLGDKNWWIPKWLDKILPNLNVEGDHAAVAALEAQELKGDEVQ